MCIASTAAVEPAAPVPDHYCRWPRPATAQLHAADHPTHAAGM